MGYETKLYVGERCVLEGTKGDYIFFMEKARFDLSKLGDRDFSNIEDNHSKIFTTPVDFDVNEFEVTEDSYDPETNTCKGTYKQGVREDRYGDVLHYGKVEDVIAGLMRVYVENDNYQPVIPVIAYLNSIKSIYKDLVVVMYGY